jgi:hypothetical protein
MAGKNRINNWKSRGRFSPIGDNIIANGPNIPGIHRSIRYQKNGVGIQQKSKFGFSRRAEYGRKNDDGTLQQTREITSNPIRRREINYWSDGTGRIYESSRFRKNTKVFDVDQEGNVTLRHAFRRNSRNTRPAETAKSRQAALNPALPHDSFRPTPEGDRLVGWVQNRKFNDPSRADGSSRGSTASAKRTPRIAMDARRPVQIERQDSVLSQAGSVEGTSPSRTGRRDVASGNSPFPPRSSSLPAERFSGQNKPLSATPFSPPPSSQGARLSSSTGRSSVDASSTSRSTRGPDIGSASSSDRRTPRESAVTTPEPEVQRATLAPASPTDPRSPRITRLQVSAMSSAASGRDSIETAPGSARLSELSMRSGEISIGLDTSTSSSARSSTAAHDKLGDRSSAMPDHARAESGQATGRTQGGLDRPASRLDGVAAQRAGDRPHIARLQDNAANWAASLTATLDAIGREDRPAAAGRGGQDTGARPSSPAPVQGSTHGGLHIPMSRFNTSGTGRQSSPSASDLSVNSPREAALRALEGRPDTATPIGEASAKSTQAARQPGVEKLRAIVLAATERQQARAAATNGQQAREAANQSGDQGPRGLDPHPDRASERGRRGL